MKITKKGKYTDKTYKCDICGCEFEIDCNDMEYETYEILDGKYESFIKIYCPECGFEVESIETERFYKNDNSNNN